MCKKTRSHRDSKDEHLHGDVRPCENYRGGERSKGYPGYICKTVAANPQYSLTCMLVVGLRLLSHVVEFPSICSSKFAPDSQLFFPQRQFLSSPNWSIVVALKAF